MLQSKAGYIDARPLTASSAKPLATHGRTIHSGQTEKSGLAHRQVRFAFKNGHRQCGYWSRSSRKCPLAIAPRGNSLADHFFIFNAAPSKVVTMACISPSLVM